VDACVVVQYINATEGLGSKRHQRLDLGIDSDVAQLEGGLATSSYDFVSDSPSDRMVDSGKNTFGAFSGC